VNEHAREVIEGRKALNLEAIQVARAQVRDLDRQAAAIVERRKAIDASALQAIGAAKECDTLLDLFPEDPPSAD